MYLNGAKLELAAKALHLTKDEVQKRSGITAEAMTNYWSKSVSTITKEDLDALAKVLQIPKGKASILLVKKAPKGKDLPSDKFVSQKGDIKFKKKQS